MARTGEPVSGRVNTISTVAAKPGHPPSTDRGQRATHCGTARGTGARSSCRSAQIPGAAGGHTRPRKSSGGGSAIIQASSNRQSRRVGACPRSTCQPSYGRCEPDCNACQPGGSHVSHISHCTRRRTAAG